LYKEPHLQKKSDECTVLWYMWKELKDARDPHASEVRKIWSKCASELGDMISQEVKTNPKYKNLYLE